jgi:hypothetical protein
MSTAASLQTLQLAQDGSFRGKPQVSMAGETGFGRLSAIDLVNEQLAIGGTVNKDGGSPVSSDDRAVIIVPVAGGGQAPD